MPNWARMGECTLLWRATSLHNMTGCTVILLDEAPWSRFHCLMASLSLPCRPGVPTACSTGCQLPTTLCCWSGDLQNLVLSSKDGEEALRGVAAYLRQHTRPNREVFTPHSRDAPTWEFALQVAKNNDILVELWAKATGGRFQNRRTRQRSRGRRYLTLMTS